MQTRTASTDRLGILAGLTVVLGVLAVGLVELQPRQPNVVVVVADTLRADHLSVFGYARDTSPQLSELSQRGVAFPRAYSQAPYTSKSIEALFTGDLPSPAGTASTRALPEWRTTLAEHFAAAGYQTAGFSANPLVSRETGHAQGFESFEMERLNYRPAPDVLQAGLDWLDDRDRARPFLLYLHLIDPHAPYAAPQRDDLWRGDYAGPVRRETSSRYVVGIRERGLEPFEHELGEPVEPADIARLVSLYDASIHYLDRVFAAFFQDLELRGRLDDTIVVLVSDHGEEFFEHGSLGHGRTLFEHQVHVPLFVWGPGLPAGVRIDELVAVADVMPTLLDLTSTQRSAGGYGRSLQPLWSGGGRARTSVASTRPSATTPLMAVRTADAKLVRTPDGPQWFDLDRDPTERHPLDDPRAARSRPERMDALRDHADRVAAQLTRIDPGTAAPAEAVTDVLASPMLSPEIESQLRALGYSVEQ